MEKKEISKNAFWELYFDQNKSFQLDVIKLENLTINFKFDLSLDEKDIHFKNCDFGCDIFIKSGSNIENTSEIIFEKCIFSQKFDMSHCKLHKNAKFWQSTFNQVNFHNTTFNKLADFWSCTFNENVIFYKTDFLGTTVFSAATFNKSVLFTYTSISKVIIFRGTRFENGLDLSQAIISGNISLHDIKIKKFKAVDNTDDNDKYENYITTTGEIPYSNKRETFRILKQAYSKNSNEIDSLEYRKREHFTLFKETWRDLVNFRKIGSSLQNLFILLLNLTSNYFGVSWIVGFVFITLIGGIFFLMSITEIPEYYFTFNCSKWETEHFKHFLEFLNPTHKFEYIQEENLTTKFYIFDFLGRIFVGYGIYQFIQAFRKYK